MPHNNSVASERADQCPPLADLVAWATGDVAHLDAQSRVQEIEEHLDTCAQCQNLIEVADRVATATLVKDLLRTPRRRPMPAELENRMRAWLGNLGTLAAGLLIFVAASGAGYVYGRAAIIAKIEVLLAQLGLKEPITTQGFVVTAPDTLSLSATIDKRSIKKVIARPLPGQEEVLYDAAEAEDGVTTVHATKVYSRQGPWVGKVFKAEVEFVPFGDLPPALLPPKERLTVNRDILVTPALGIVLDPGSEPVSLDITDTLHTRADGRYDIRGVSHQDGTLFVLVRHEVEAGLWRLQNQGKGLQVHAGDLFIVPCEFYSPGKFSVAAVVLPGDSKSPWGNETMTADWTLPPSDARFGPRVVLVTCGQSDGDLVPRSSEDEDDATKTREPGVVIRSPDGKYEARKTDTKSGVHYEVKLVDGGDTVLITSAEHPSWNQVVAGRFSADSTEFAAAYHYGHEGKYTWIGVWSLKDGEFVGDVRKKGEWTYDIPSSAFEDAEK